MLTRFPACQNLDPPLHWNFCSATFFGQGTRRIQTDTLLCHPVICINISGTRMFTSYCPLAAESTRSQRNTVCPSILIKCQAPDISWRLVYSIIFSKYKLSATIIPVDKDNRTRLSVRERRLSSATTISSTCGNALSNESVVHT